MDKCWFVLPQTHYPPPQEDDQNGAVKQSGPICLGHFIKDLKHLDQVINEDGPEPFPLDMPIYRTRPVKFEWNSTKEPGYNASVSAAVPDVVTGLTAKASLAFALKKTIGQQWQIDELDTMIVQPSRRYISRCIASSSIAEFIAENKLGPTWSIFMVTGLRVVRGKSTQTLSHGQERSFHGGPGIGFAGVAEIDLEGGVSSGKTESVSAQYQNDFIWAVRLTKITKGLFDKKWTQKTFSKGATFSLDEEKEALDTVKGVLSEEDLAYNQILGIESSEESEGIEEVVVF